MTQSAVALTQQSAVAMWLQVSQNTFNPASQTCVWSIAQRCLVEMKFSPGFGHVFHLKDRLHAASAVSCDGHRFFLRLLVSNGWSYSLKVWLFDQPSQLRWRWEGLLDLVFVKHKRTVSPFRMMCSLNASHGRMIQSNALFTVLPTSNGLLMHECLYVSFPAMPLHLI